MTFIFIFFTKIQHKTIVLMTGKGGGMDMAWTSKSFRLQNGIISNQEPPAHTHRPRPRRGSRPSSQGPAGRAGLGSRSGAHRAENHRRRRRRSDGPGSTLGTLSRRGVPPGVKSKLASWGRGRPGPRRQGVTCGRPGKPT